MKKTIVVVLTLVLAFSFTACAGSDANIENHENELQLPLSSDDTEYENYKDVMTRFENAGFKNITLEKIDDLITGWLTKDGEIDSVSVNGETDFIASTWYSKDAKIVIRYHTFPEANTNDDSKGTKSENKDESKPVEEPNTTVSDYVGKDAVEAKDELTAQGYTVTLLFETTDVDFTEEVDYSNADNHYIITKQNKPKGKKITLYINAPENIDRINAREKQRKNLEAKLGPSYAWGACKMYGDSEYPYGFKVHIATGMLAEEPSDDDTWFLKASCEVKNAYGVKAEGTVECKVTGTSNNPKVVYFIVY
jgi:hypothetical protein